MASETEVERYLLEHPIFADVEGRIVQAFAARCRFNAYPSGTMLLKQGQRGDVLMFLSSGAVHFRARLGARAATLSILRAPAVFSLGAIIEQTSAMADAIALDDVEVVSVEGFVVRDLMLADPRFASNVTVQLSRTVRGFVRSVVEQKLLTGPKRLANFLADEFDRQGQTAEIVLPFQRQVIASLLGMTPENLSRAFALLERHGVTNDRMRVTAKSLEAVRAFAQA